jgi:hypothetical protein
MMYARIFIFIPAIVCILYTTVVNAQQSTNSDCSPAINSVKGNVTTNCNLTRIEVHREVVMSLSQALGKAQWDSQSFTVPAIALLHSQQHYFIPLLQRYETDPTPGNWKVAKHWVDETNIRLAKAIDAAIEYDSNLNGNLGSDLKDLHDTYLSRVKLLSQLSDQPPSPQFVHEWSTKYDREQRILAKQILTLRKILIKSQIE